ncbi:DNA-binding SARP family transcriptional activator [Kitasatospora sp. MAP12-15]|uniref:AfsR/SARP family transcriptional regulator n=1 Tax=unclassified Kitasatospora TaxID=2633591 RepID=UPI00247656F0|nr:BTAD domain-containing putative transcriptional regulator [Kitasatospora sp. MAP12-44]MDH6111712.1 DNA-binding SARP family transcriptional activator/tetratricopeptide (TPR) repeat protein [Kitasatospora sp. MAP12-44]
MTDAEAPGHGEFRFRLLGPPDGRLDGEPLELGAPQQQAMLAMLLLRAGTPVRARDLIDALWDEQPPARAVGVLRQYAWRLRAVLEPDRMPRAAGALLVSVGDGYTLRLPPSTLDVHHFEQDLRVAARARESGEPHAAHARLTRALDRWTGGLALSGLPGPYARSQRDRLAELRLDAQEDLLDNALQLGRHGEVADELGVLLAQHPLRERFAAQLMLAQYRCGRQAQALAVYTDTRRRLAEELGVEPGEELRLLRTRILAADPELSRRAVLAPAPARATGRPIAAPPAPTAGLPPQQLPADVADFTGRAQLVEQVVGALDRPDRTAVAVSVFSGIGGVGKTALAVHVAHLVRPRFPDGQLYADLRGPGPAPTQTGTVLARFLEALGTAPDAIPEDDEQRAVHYRSLLADRRVLVVLDNAHDTAQVRLLLPGGPGCAVLVTTRSRTVLLPGARQVDLEPLGTAESLDLLGSVVGPERIAQDPAAALELVSVCGRLPLALRIVAARLTARPNRPLAALLTRLADTRRRLDELRVGDLAVAATFELGYSALAPEHARAFRLLAVPDAEELPLHAAAAVLGDDPDTAESLAEELVDAGLLEAHGTARYRFHDLLKLYARQQAGGVAAAAGPVAAAGAAVGAVGAVGAREPEQAVLRLLHHLLATVRNASCLLEPGHGLHTSLQAAQTPGLAFADEAAARHWLRTDHVLLAATAEQALALPLGLAAAVDLLLLWFGLTEGPAHRWEFRRLVALAVTAAERAGRPGCEARARYISGTLHYMTDAYPLAEDELRYSMALAEQAEDTVCRQLTANTLGILNYATGRPAAALQLLRQAEELCEHTADLGSRSRILSTLSRVHLALDRPAEATEAVDEAVRLARICSHPADLSRVLYQYGCVLRRTGRTALAVSGLREALGHFRAQQQRDLQALCLARLAECRLDLGDHQDAADCAGRSLELARELGKAYCQGLAHAVLGQALPALGRPAEGLAQLREALVVFRRLGVPEADAVVVLLQQSESRTA